MGYGRGATAPIRLSRLWEQYGWLLAHFPRSKFDYVWLIEPAPFDPLLLHGMTKIWAAGPDALYRVDDRRPLAQQLGPS